MAKKDDISGPQKAAILLLAMGEESAAEVMRHFDEDEALLVASQMENLARVTPAQLEHVVGEFYQKKKTLPAPKASEGPWLLADVLPSAPEMEASEEASAEEADPPGRPSFLATHQRQRQDRQQQDRQPSEEREPAPSLSSSSGPALSDLPPEPEAAGGSSAAQVIALLKRHAPQQIATILQGEHPQVVAVMLAHLRDPALVRGIVRAWPAAFQRSVIPRLKARLKADSAPPLTPTVWREIELSLTQELHQLGQMTTSPSPRAGSLASLTAELTTEATTTKSARPESHRDADYDADYPDRAASTRSASAPSAPLVLEDLLRFRRADVRRILAQCEDEDVVLAMKLASQDLQRHLLSSVAPPFARIVRNALSLLGPTGAAEVEAAQRRLLAVAGKMIQHGELELPQEASRSS